MPADILASTLHTFLTVTFKKPTTTKILAFSQKNWRSSENGLKNHSFFLQTESKTQSQIKPP